MSFISEAVTCWGLDPLPQTSTPVTLLTVKAGMVVQGRGDINPISSEAAPAGDRRRGWAHQYLGPSGQAASRSAPGTLRAYTHNLPLLPPTFLQ